LLKDFNHRILLEHFKKQKGSTAAWVNEQSDDGFTPIHLAAYRGNLAMIEYLIENGADMYLRNRHGMNAMHISAQGDQVA
jgi:ankyrin repeat protein